MVCLLQRHLVSTFCIFSFLSGFCLFDIDRRNVWQIFFRRTKVQAALLPVVWFSYSCVLLLFAILVDSCQSSVMMLSEVQAWMIIVRVGSRQLWRGCHLETFAGHPMKKSVKYQRLFLIVGIYGSLACELFFLWKPKQKALEIRRHHSLPHSSSSAAEKDSLSSLACNLNSFCSQEALPIFSPFFYRPLQLTNYLTTLSNSLP